MNLLTILTGRPVGMNTLNSHMSDILEINNRREEHMTDSDGAADSDEIHDL